MDFTQFEQQARADAEVLELARAVAGQLDADGLPQSEQKYVTGAEALLGLAIYVLYRYAKDAFDHQRAQNETEVAAQRARIVQDFVNDGFTPEMAAKVTDGLLTQIAKRTENDLGVEKVIGLIGGPKS